MQPGGGAVIGGVDQVPALVGQRGSRRLVVQLYFRVIVVRQEKIKIIFRNNGRPVAVTVRDWSKAKKNYSCMTE